jgi:hypothetical protein
LERGSLLLGSIGTDSIILGSPIRGPDLLLQYLNSAFECPDS